MPTPVASPSTESGSITDRAMLISLTIRQWSATRHDKRASKEVSDNHSSDPTMGRYNKSLVAKDALAKLTEIKSKARTEHYARTLPWNDDGRRILTSAGYFAYSQKMADLRAEWESAVNHFDHAYPRYVADARTKLNGLFDPSEYPDINSIRSKFEFSTRVDPMPSSEDFRVYLGNAETARIKRDIQEQAQQTINAAMRDVWKRCYDVTSKMSERLKGYSVNQDKVTGAFRDSLVSNVSDLLDLLPSLNLTHDPTLDSIAKDMRDNLTSYSPDELRDQDSARQRVADSADKILAVMEDYI